MAAGADRTSQHAEPAQGLDQSQIDDLVAEADTGARQPAGAVGTFLAVVAFIWAVFQLYTASNIPFTLSSWLGVNVTLNGNEIRQIHLAFALFLAFCAYPAFKSAPRDHIPVYDWILALGGVSCCLYLYVFQGAIAERPGLPVTSDLVISALGLVLLLLATLRSLGLPLVMVASVFLLYVFFGDSKVLPDVVQWKGASFGKAMWHFWMQTEGVFGVALGVSASFIFLFVLFGSLLDRAGAGNFFIQCSFAGLGHLRGGPAKAAVISSAMTGLISGSSIANVVTTGTFTMPLMKRVGFSAEKAGAVEVASSVNGQIMPPVMGAAAFLMVEFVGISYVDVITHAFLPAAISYVALVYIVHLEALKAGMEGLPKPGPAKNLLQKVTGFLTGFGIVAAITAAIYYGLGFLKGAMPDGIAMASSILFLAVYLLLLGLASRSADLELDDPNAPVTVLPELVPTLVTGLYYVIPMVVLIWCLVIERLSPGLSAFYASAGMIVILFTQRPMKAILRGEGGRIALEFLGGVLDFRDGMIAGARNMIGIAVATGAAGVIVGTISLTGAHQIVGEFIEFLSGGNLMLMLVLVAIFSLILGMGLPTTANYIVVSSLLAAVVVELGAQSGLVVPLIAVHLFVFYFGLMADVTPPVGLASFAAAAVSGGDPIKTGFTAFWYSMRTAALPFLFIFNTQLLLMGIEGWFDFTLTVVSALIAMMVFAAGTMGYFVTRSRIWETVALLLIAFTLFRPGFWWDMVYPPLESAEPSLIAEAANDASVEQVRIRVVGETLEGKMLNKVILLPLPAVEEGATIDGEARLYETGIAIREEEGKAFIDDVVFGSAAEKMGLDFDYEITEVLVPTDRPAKEWMFIPALLLLAGIVAVQRARAGGARRRNAEAVA